MQFLARRVRVEDVRVILGHRLHLLVLLIHRHTQVTLHEFQLVLVEASGVHVRVRVRRHAAQPPPLHHQELQSHTLKTRYVLRKGQNEDY